MISCINEIRTDRAMVGFGPQLKTTEVDELKMDFYPPNAVA